MKTLLPQSVFLNFFSEVEKTFYAFFNPVPKTRLSRASFYASCGEKSRLSMIILLFVGMDTRAQYFEDDARLWLNLNVTSNFGKKWEGQLLIQNRLNDNMSRYNGYACLSAAYRFNKNFKVLAGYVMGAAAELNGAYSPIQQSFAGIMLRKKYKRYLFVYRNLTQSQLRGYNQSDFGSTLRLFNRNKFTVKYELTKRWQVYAATEVYITLLDRAKYEQVGRMRYITGLNYKLTKRQVIEPYFLFQRNYVLKGAPVRNFIYGLTYNIEF